MALSVRRSTIHIRWNQYSGPLWRLLGPSLGVRHTLLSPTGRQEPPTRLAFRPTVAPRQPLPCRYSPAVSKPRTTSAKCPSRSGASRLTRVAPKSEIPAVRPPPHMVYRWPGLSARQRAKAPCHIPSSFAEKVIFRPPECGRYLPTLYWNAP